MAIKEPTSVKIANEFRADLLSQEAGAASIMARRWAAVEREIGPKLEALVTEIEEARAAGKEISRITILQMDRYRALLGQLTAEYTKFNRVVENNITGLQENAVKMARRSAKELILATASDINAVGLTFNRLSTEAAENIAALARAGQPLKDVLSKGNYISINSVTNKLISGVAAGVNPRQVTRDLINEGLALNFQHALLVTRDQHMRAYRTATMQAYKSSGVVTRYRRLAAKNDRTCLACLALDGEEFALDDFMPLHPQDRCTLLPVITGLGPVLQPVKFETGEEWFKRQAEDYQRKALGPGRFKLWQEGGFSFKQLVTVKNNDIWGPGAQVTTLRDLRRGLGGLRSRLPLPPKPGGQGGPGAKADPGRPPRFKSKRAATKWMKDNYPELPVDFGRMELEAIQNVIDANFEMAAKYPLYHTHLSYIGTYTNKALRPEPRKRRRKQFDGEIAHANYKHGYMGLNPKYFNDLELFRKAEAASAAANWTYTGANPPAATFYHEFGHIIDGFFRNNDPPPGAAISSGHAVLESWSILAKSRGGISRYGMTLSTETIAESFSAIHNLPRDKWPIAAKELNRLLELLENEYRFEFPEPPKFTDSAQELRWYEEQEKDRLDRADAIFKVAYGEYNFSQEG